MIMEQAIGNHCGYDTPLGQHIVCGDFYYGRVKKRIIPNHDAGGWEFLDEPTRQMDYAAKNQVEKRGQEVVDHSGDPYLFSEICPHCGGELAPVEIRSRPVIPPKGDPTGDGE